MAQTMVSVEQVREQARKTYGRKEAEWACECFSAARARAGAQTGASDASSSSRPESRALFSMALHPPTEKAALADVGGTDQWVRSWRECSIAEAVTWEERRWGSLGVQRLPVRVDIYHAEEVAAFAGQAKAWHQVSSRALRLAQAWERDEPVSGNETSKDGERTTVSDLCRALQQGRALSPEDWERACHVVQWLTEHPQGGSFARQLPIRGIDTKWYESHKRVIESLYKARTGNAAPALRKPPRQMRVRFLDSALVPCGLRELSAAPEELARLGIAPKAVLICENLVNVLALPSFDGVVAVHGGGYGVDAVASIPWMTDAPLLYWGDLDTHGFAILNRLRTHVPHARSLLMDAATLRRYEDLCVEEPAPSTARLDFLTDAEVEAYDALATLRPGKTLRLEQERIPWEHALEAVRKALASASSL